MADLIIRGLHLPKSLGGEETHIDIRIFSDGTVIMATSRPPYYQKFDAVPLPEGHGRLIDADAFKAMCLSATKEARPDFIRHEDWLKSCAVTMSFCRDIDERPTIVPPEGGNADGN